MEKAIIFLQLEDYTNVGVEVSFNGGLEYIARILVEKYNDRNDVIELINKSESVADLTPESNGKVFAASSIENIQNLEFFVYNQDNELEGNYNSRGYFIPKMVKNIEVENYDYLCVLNEFNEWLVSYNIKENKKTIKCEFENLEANIPEF